MCVGGGAPLSGLFDGVAVKPGPTKARGSSNASLDKLVKVSQKLSVVPSRLSRPFVCSLPCTCDLRTCTTKGARPSDTSAFWAVQQPFASILILFSPPTAEWNIWLISSQTLRRHR